MKRNLIFVAVCGGLLLLHFSAYAAKDVPTVRHVDVLSSGSHLEIEITTSEPLTPQTQIITGPNRLIVDFPGALPDARLHNLAVNRGEVKGVRVGLFTRNPPTTRLVFDLTSALQYQIFPSGRTLIVKLGASLPANVAGNSRPNSGSPAVLKQVSAKGIGMVTGGTVTPLPTVAMASTTAAAPAPDVRVEFREGKLSIWADKATLASVLYEIQRRTGAEVSIPPSASQEKIVADIPPSPAREAIAALLDGSNFDFILIGSEKNPQALHSIILTTRGQDSGGDQAFFPAVQSPPESQPSAPPDVQDNPPSDVQSTPEPQPDMVPQPQPENQDPQN